MMNWQQFFLWITGIYTLYYLVMILLDLKGSVRLTAGKAISHELTFTESVKPDRVEPEDDTITVASPAALPPGRGMKAKPEVISSGGVSLKAMFTLAREEAIIYTRPVSF